MCKVPFIHSASRKCVHVTINQDTHILYYHNSHCTVQRLINVTLTMKEGVIEMNVTLNDGES